VCWRFAYLSSSNTLWKRKFEKDFKISAVREHHQWTQLYSHALPRGKKGYNSVRGKNQMAKKDTKQSKSRQDQKKTTRSAAGNQEKQKHLASSPVLPEENVPGASDDSDTEDTEGAEDIDSYEDILNADICVGRVTEDTWESTDRKTKERPIREKLKKLQRTGRDKDVVRYCLYHYKIKNDPAHWKNRYRELMTDILIQRVLLKHTNRVIWGKNSIKGRSPPVSATTSSSFSSVDVLSAPKYQRKSLHLLVDANGYYHSTDQIDRTAGTGIERVELESSTAGSSLERLSHVTSLSPVPTPPLMDSSRLSNSATFLLRTLPPAFSSPSFYCPYKFHVCSQRGKLHVGDLNSIISSGDYLLTWVCLLNRMRPSSGWCRTRTRKSPSMCSSMLQEMIYPRPR